jgi:hypothetical protein
METRRLLYNALNVKVGLLQVLLYCSIYFQMILLAYAKGAQGGWSLLNK